MYHFKQADRPCLECTFYIRCKAPHETGSQLAVWLSHIEPAEASPQAGAVPHTPFGEVKKRQQRRSADRRRCCVPSRKLKGVDVFTVTCKVKQNGIIMEYHRVPLLRMHQSNLFFPDIYFGALIPDTNWYWILMSSWVELKWCSF